MAELPHLYDVYDKLRLFRTDKPEDEKTPAAFNGRFLDVTEAWLSEDEPGEAYPTGTITTTTSISDRRFGDFSLILRRIIIPQQKPQLQLEIQSISLRSEFRRVAQHLSNAVNLNGNPIVINAPYSALYHARDELEAAIQQANSDTIRQELLLLEKFQNEHMARQIKEIQSSLEIGMISSDCLWALFKPGELLLLTIETPLGERRSVLSCGVCLQYTTFERERLWEVHVRHMTVGDNVVGTTDVQYAFPMFLGYKPIDSLPVYPLRYCKDEKRVRKDLEERGRKYLRLCFPNNTSATKISPVIQEYAGPLWMQVRPGSTKGCALYDPPATTIHGRVIIDHAGFVSEKSVFQTKIISSRLRGSGKINSHDSSDYDAEDSASHIISPHTNATTAEDHVNSIDQLDSESLMAFPARIPGYSLVTKSVGFLLVDGLDPVVWEAETVNDLMRKNRRMKQVRDIVAGFTYRTHKFDYSIAEKGRGLVFLFYGPSGGGKTLTSECVAESLTRPLYRVNGSDLGSNADEIEANLQLVFDRVARWEAILLLDEADAYMAERSDDSLERNTLVSILLRLLEYQSGIVVLTTNRYDSFDPAFHSRVHVRIRFPGLTANERQTVWRTSLIKAATSAQHALEVSDEDYERLGGLELDGRSIHNVVRVAELSTRHKDGGITLGDIKSVLEISLGTVTDTLRQQLEELFTR
ncbi:P-loop containing nucleoside triphosphate hydrolase protein [Aspergillus similis]